MRRVRRSLTAVSVSPSTSWSLISTPGAPTLRVRSLSTMKLSAVAVGGVRSTVIVTVADARRWSWGTRPRPTCR